MTDDYAGFVTFRFNHPVAGGKVDANGNVPTEEVVLRVPISTIVTPVSTEPPLELSLIPDDALLQLYARFNKLPGDIKGDWLLSEINRRGLHNSNGVS